MAEITAREIAEQNTILRCVVGSSVHGLALEGTDDRDEMGICIEPQTHVIGLRQFEQYVQRDRPEGVRSQAGDLDLVVYGLRKWARLALNGNPSILAMLFVPPSALVSYEHIGRDLQKLAPAFASKRAGQAFLGYMQQQRQRLMGERGQKNVKRPELVDAHGFDTKYAGHIIRLGYQGIEYLTTGRLTLPMPEAEREQILAVRRGEVDENATLTLAGELEQQLKDALDSSPLPDAPDHARVERFLIDAYSYWWRTEYERHASNSEERPA